MEASCYTLGSSVLLLFRVAAPLETRCNEMKSHNTCWYMSVCNSNIASYTYLYKDLKIAGKYRIAGKTVEVMFPL